jgi:hypothetical protein
MSHHPSGMASRAEASVRKGEAWPPEACSRREWVGGEEETTTRQCTGEKSDHLIRALKPGNAGGAKEVTG